MYPETYPVYCKFIVDDKFDIKTILVVGVILGDIINKLQSANPDRIFIYQDIYNARMDICREVLGLHTPIQALMEELGKGDDFYLDF